MRWNGGWLLNREEEKDKKGKDRWMKRQIREKERERDNKQEKGKERT
jgi:hypothetical protein